MAIFILLLYQSIQHMLADFTLDVCVCMKDDMEVYMGSERQQISLFWLTRMAGWCLWKDRLALH